VATVPGLCGVLGRLTGETADEAARATGFVRRRSKLGGAAFVRAVVFGWLNRPDASLAELAQTAAAVGVPISAQGLDQRFTEWAAALLRAVLEAALGAAVAAEPVAVPLLRRFAGVYLLDTTLVPLPDALAAAWRGCGGDGPATALKVPVRLDLATGALALGLEQGRTHDQRVGLQRAPLPAGALRVTDVGFFDAAALAAAQAAGVDHLGRPPAHVRVVDAAGRSWEQGAFLAARGADRVDAAVALGRDRPLAGRLLAVRVPQAVADRRRQRLRADVRSHGRAPSAARLALAAWTVLFTTAPADRLSLDEALALARARWRVELLVKRWKSGAHLARSRSAKPARVFCELYAKLLAALVQHWLLVAGCWAYPDRSLVKAAATVRRHALALATALGRPTHLAAAIAALRRCLRAGGRINPRRKHPNTYQLLLDPARAGRFA
jgi:hypothetical protein